MGTQDPVLVPTDEVEVTRIDRILPMRLEGLWSYFTEPSRFNLWFPRHLVAVDAQLGGAVEFTTAIGGHEVGQVIAFDVPQMYAFTLGQEQFRFETHPEPAATLLVFRHFSLLTDADRPRWEAALDKLERVLAPR